MQTFFGIELHELKIICADLLEPCTWPFLQHHRKTVTSLPTLEQLEAKCGAIEEHITEHPDCVVAVPRIFGRHRVVLHAFSGEKAERGRAVLHGPPPICPCGVHALRGFHGCDCQP